MAPFAADFDVSSLAPTNQLSVQLERNDRWVFASEFQFRATAVPEPGTYAMLVGTAVFGGSLLRRRK